MKIGKVLALYEPDDIHEDVLKALGYESSDPAAPLNTVAEIVAALRATAGEKPDELLVGICHIEMRDNRVLYPAVSVFPFLDTITFQKVAEWDDLSLESAPELDGYDNVVIWSLSEAEAKNLASAGKKLPVPLKKLTFSQLQSVLLSDDFPAFAASLIARYLLDHNLVKAKEDNFDYASIIDAGLEEAGLRCPKNLEPYLELYCANDRYHALVSWKEAAARIVWKHFRG